MATPAERLAASLAQLADLQKDGRRVFRSNELTRVHRQRLLQNGFLRAVMRGWLISCSPGADPGDTTPWFACFWEFCARYCAERFSDQWHLSQEQSLLLHAESSVIPQQVVVYSPRATNNTVGLPFGTSLFHLKRDKLPPEDDLVERDGLRLYAPEVALTKVSKAFFTRNPIEAQVVLAGVPDVSVVARSLLEGGHTAVAGRLAGAFRRVDRAEVADDILHSMKAAGYDVRETDPFEPTQTFGSMGQANAPIVERLHMMWEVSREAVIEAFPEPPGLPRGQKAYLRLVDHSYRSDAYHSLSIEGYRVSPELVERVRSGDWDPRTHDADRRNRDALAARGYWQAFQLVRETLAATIAGDDPVRLVDASHRGWYRELFQPCVAAGLMEASALAGYRNEAVYINRSRHVPPCWEAVRDAMPALFDLLASETEPSVRAVLAHWLFGYIHPYPDGNGRLARFVMNIMLASGGYPWTIIRVDDRETYLAGLERASVDTDIRPFARFLAHQVQRSADT